MAFPTNPSPGDSYTDGYGTVWVYAGAVNGWYRQSVSTPNDTSYTAAISGPAGSNTQVQFNDNGELAGDSGLTYDKTTDALSGGAFIPTGNTVPTNGLYRPSANNVAISTNGTGKLFIDSAGKVTVKGVGTAAFVVEGTAPDNSLFIQGSTGYVGLGISTPGAKLVVDGGTSGDQFRLGTDPHYYKIGRNSISGPLEFYGTQSGVTGYVFGGVDGTRLTIDSSGRLLVGTSSARDNIYGFTSGIANRFQIEGTGYSDSAMIIVRNSNDGNFGGIVIGKTRGTSVNSNTIVQNNDDLGQISFQGADGQKLVSAAEITAEVDGTPGANDMPGRLVFSTTADGASSPTERMRITQSGFVNIGSQGTDVIWDQTSATGVTIGTAGVIQAARSNDQLMLLNRIGNDGALITFAQDGTTEGSITISGSTVSYNGAHLSRWTQLPGGAERTEILRGTVLSNIDEMCEWGDEDNEQLNRMKVSDVEGDKNVAGVFQAWDDDDDTYTNDFYCAMTGDFIIRIGAGVTVERGDLLMSAGDGTAKPQDDDIIRSKTIAKVTSTNVSCTYEDGSYCVPCVLMAC